MTQPLQESSKPVYRTSVIDQSVRRSRAKKLYAWKLCHDQEVKTVTGMARSPRLQVLIPEA
jgi:hypothetical protein